MNSISAVDIMYILLEDDAHPQQKGAKSDVTQHEKTNTVYPQQKGAKSDMTTNTVYPQQKEAKSDVTQHENNTNPAGDHKSDSTVTLSTGLDNTEVGESLLEGMLYIYLILQFDIRTDFPWLR